jgi:MFS family permease
LGAEVKQRAGKSRILYCQTPDQVADRRTFNYFSIREKRSGFAGAYHTAYPWSQYQMDFAHNPLSHLLPDAGSTGLDSELISYVESRYELHRVAYSILNGKVVCKYTLCLHVNQHSQSIDSKRDELSHDYVIMHFTMGTSHNSPAETTTPLKWIVMFCGVTFFYWAATYLYQPILSVYAKSIGASLSMVGIIVAAYGIPQLLFRIPIGVWFDSVNRKKSLIALGITMTTLGALGLGLASSPWQLFGARFVTGIGSAAWVTLSVFFTAYYTTQSGVKRAISLINFVQGAALVSATFFGGLIANEFGYSYAFFGAAVLGVIALIFLMFAGQPAMTRTNGISLVSVKSALTSVPLLTVSLMGVLSQFANYSGLFGFVPIYAANIGASSADLGIINTICLASSAVASLAVVRVTKMWGTSFVIMVGAVLLGGAIVVVPLIHSLTLLNIAMVFNGLGRGLLATLLMALSIQGMPPQQRATAMGTYQAIYAIGMLAGPLTSGFLANSLGLNAVFYLSTFCCLATAGVAYLPSIRRLGSG